LIQYLNRLGICSSLDTLSRVIQQHVNMREHKGPEEELNSSAMMIVSADNIDFMYRYDCNFSGRQSTSWHGTTVQIVQPCPNLPLLGPPEYTGSSEGVGSLSESPLHLVPSSCANTACPMSPLKETTIVDQVFSKGTKRGQLLPHTCTSPNKSCKSPNQPSYTSY